MTGKGGGWGRQRWRVGGAWAFPPLAPVRLRSGHASTGLSMSGTTTRRKLKGENSYSRLSVGWCLRFLAGPRNDREGRGWVFWGGCDGLVGRGPPPRSTLRVPQGERPHIRGADHPHSLEGLGTGSSPLPSRERGLDTPPHAAGGGDVVCARGGDGG